MRNGRVSLPTPQTEPANKRRRIERQSQFEMEQLPMELRYCDGGRYDGGRSYANNLGPECALRDDASGTACLSLMGIPKADQMPTSVLYQEFSM